jgi:hypothetical protein
MTCFAVCLFDGTGFQFDFARKGWADSRPWIAPDDRGKSR